MWSTTRWFCSKRCKILTGESVNNWNAIKYKQMWYVIINHVCVPNVQEHFLIQNFNYTAVDKKKKILIYTFESQQQILFSRFVFASCEPLTFAEFYNWIQLYLENVKCAKLSKSQHFFENVLWIWQKYKSFCWSISLAITLPTSVSNMQGRQSVNLSINQYWEQVHRPIIINWTSDLPKGS